MPITTTATIKDWKEGPNITRIFCCLSFELEYQRPASVHGCHLWYSSFHQQVMFLPNTFLDIQHRVEAITHQDVHLSVDHQRSKYFHTYIKERNSYIKIYLFPYVKERNSLKIVKWITFRTVEWKAAMMLISVSSSFKAWQNFLQINSNLRFSFNPGCTSILNDLLNTSITWHNCLPYSYVLCKISSQFNL